MTHVDSEHLYEHMHLPPHYLVMFLPALATQEELDFRVGQTAFLVGSHKKDIARDLTEGVGYLPMNEGSRTADAFARTYGQAMSYCLMRE